MQSTAARMRDHKVEMELDAAERRRRLTRVRVQQHRRAEDEAAMGG